MLLRKLGKAALGKATPTQTMLATVLGSMLGFVPSVFLLGFGGAATHSPGTLLSLLFLVLILNANLAIWGVSLLAGKVLGLLLLPASFEVGRWLLDGPTGPAVGALINAPVFAWFGLEHYATTGSLALGLGFGVAFGLGLIRLQRGLLAKLASLEDDSEGFRTWTGKRSVRFLAWLLLGAKRGSRSWREHAEDRRRGSPVRLLGVGAVAVLAIGLFLAQSFLASPAFRSLAKSGLESLNGATVDLERAAVDVSGGRIDLAGLAMANAESLGNNVFDARSLELEIDTGNLLRKRFVIAEVTSREAATGTARPSPGERIHRPTPAEPPAAEPEEKSLEDYLKEAEVWKGRLARIAEVIERVFAPSDPDDTPASRERELEDQVQRLGLARAAAHHLIEGSPLLLIRELTFEGVAATELGTKLDIRGRNLSTDPRLVEEPLSLSLQSRDGRIAFGLDAAGGQGLRARFAWKGISAATIASLLKSSPMSGGTVDLDLDGLLDPSRPEGLWLDVPLRLTLHDTELSLGSLPAAQVEELTVPLGIRGPLSAPRIALDDQQIVDALVAAGEQELAKQLRSALGDKLPAGVGDVIDGAKTPEQLLEEAKRKAEAAAKQKAAGELEKLLPGLGGKKVKK